MANEKRLIDANAWKPFFNELKNKIEVYNPYDDGYEDALDNVDDWMDAQPAVDAVEVIHAKWENVQKGKGCCSNCHRLDSVDSLATHCRYCGAKMDGDGNG